MENKVYYGEYSLKHWIDLMLKKNIILPDYQRHFVWKEDAVRDFVKALKNKQFIPPVTIGALNIDNKLQNLILDGQQRLTSILLAYLDLFPERDEYNNPINQIANENDDDDDEQLDIIEWTFKTYIEEKNEGRNGHYHKLNLTDIDNDFLNNTFLGFSYLVPANTTDAAQQKYYSTVFRNINIKGEKLLVQESRKSLYFLDSSLAQFFDPDFSKTLTINNIKIDFVRYLSLLSQYYKDNRANNVAKYYGRKLEEYYEEYIYSVAGENNSNMFNDFTEMFPDKNYNPRYEQLKQSIKYLEINTFPSIIDADMYLFGLIYETVFNDKRINKAKKNELKQKIENKISIYKDDYSHKKTPSALKHLRSRLEDSINIYKCYAV
ncbi:MAG TPA: DUF262 domain-containing protein [Bacteroidales bacterium]|nr:DUF262 domain-containing protein [Bacteroidales bacterium]HOR60125.1 DUF262 domain-containing protein [Bacteroidales bacterium]HPL04580.1 DUF262 domain-containing protein [Bacteroidales bacterium]